MGAIEDVNGRRGGPGTGAVPGAAGAVARDARGAPDTEARILDAAERCMGRFGLRRVSMADVGAEAGLSRASVYRYFADRGALVDAVLERTAARFVAASEPAVDGGAALAEQVAEAAAFIVAHRDDEEFSLGLPAGTDSLFAALLTSHHHRLFAAWVGFWQPRLAAAVGRGEVDPALDPHRTGEWIVRVLFSFAVFPASAHVDLADPDDVRDLVRTHLVDGLAPRDRTPPAAPTPPAPSRAAAHAPDRHGAGPAPREGRDEP